mmetsp:Transcript_2502/g.5025  ORF Transcript_2502/g.5025 Transcript_2502/m.5025 type:complete len:270 (+) Transcript_2502:95-904(+)
MAIQLLLRSRCWAVALLVALVGAEENDPCECLNWKQVYDSHRVFCGEGLEFHVFEGALGYDLPGISFIETNFKGIYDQFCTNFFKRMDNRYCVNIGMYPYGMPSMYAGQWCYVSKACTELNGGKAVADKKASGVGGWLSGEEPAALPRDLSWKVCVAGRDNRLRDLAPPDLLDLATRLGAEAGYVTKIAYPRLMPPEHTWASVQEAVAKGDDASMPEALRAAIAARVPIVIDEDPTAIGNQKIIFGREVYDLVNTTGWPYQRGKDVGEL